MTIPRNLSFLAQGASSTGVLGTANGGTNLTSFTVNGIPYASSSSVLTTGSALQFDGTNLGLGVTPSAWGSNFKAFQFGQSATGSISYQNFTTAFGQNFYSTNANDIALVNGYAGKYEVNGSGQHVWKTSSSVTAGSAITFTQAMTLFNSGGLSLGNTTDAGAGNLQFTTSGTNGIYFGSSSQLNDYEEGNWTPVASGDSGSLTAYTSSGRYTKIGRQVFLQGVIVLTTPGTAGGRLNVNGFPYLVANNSLQPSGTCRENAATGVIYAFFGAPNGSYGYVTTLTNTAILWVTGYSYSFNLVYTI